MEVKRKLPQNLQLYNLSVHKQKDSLSIVEEQRSLAWSFELSSPLQSSIQSRVLAQSKKINPQTFLAKTQLQVQKNISKRFQKILQSRSGEKKISLSSPQIKMTRDQKMAFCLPESLLEFSKKHHLTEKKEQIKYENTLKRMRKLGKSLGCSVRAKSQGVELEYMEEKEEKMKNIFNYTFGKQFDRFFKKKILATTKKCYDEAVSLNLTVSRHSQEITSTLKKNERDQVYKNYDCKRIETYLKAKATSKKKYPFYIKTSIEQKISKIDKERQVEVDKRDSSSILSGELDSGRVSPDKWTLSRRGSQQQSQISKECRESNRSAKLSEYNEDILQFLEICDFFERIQKQLLRYLPNNHLANKIEAVINQVKFGEAIFKIFKRSDSDRSYFTPSRIVKIIKKCEGILGTMNYIVNVIKLNISAERRKRFKDTQKNILKFQDLIKVRNREVCQRLKRTDDLALRKSIFESIANSKFQCPGMNPSYKEFAQHLEGDGSENIDSIKYTPIMCDILKFEALMK